MTRDATAPRQSRLRRTIGWLLAPVYWGITAGHALLSLRGLQLLFLLGMAAIATAGWVRPPISNDIRTWQLPLLSATAQGIDATAVLYGSRAVVWLSPGVLLLVLIAAGVGVAVFRPRRYATAMGLLLAGAIACVGDDRLQPPRVGRAIGSTA